MSAQNKQMALVQFGYQTYAVPVDSLSATLAHSYIAKRDADDAYALDQWEPKHTLERAHREWLQRRFAS